MSEGCSRAQPPSGREQQINTIFNEPRILFCSYLDCIAYSFAAVVTVRRLINVRTKIQLQRQHRGHGSVRDPETLTPHGLYSQQPVRHAVI